MNFNQILEIFKPNITFHKKNEKYIWFSTKTGFDFVIFQESISETPKCLNLNILSEITAKELLFSITLFDNKDIKDIAKYFNLEYKDVHELSFSEPITRNDVVKLLFGLLPLSLDSNIDYDFDEEVNPSDSFPDDMLLFSDFSLYGNTYFNEDDFCIFPLVNTTNPSNLISGFLFFNHDIVKNTNPLFNNSFYLSKLFSNQKYLSVCFNPSFFSQFFNILENQGNDDDVLLKEKYPDHTLLVIPKLPDISIGNIFLDTYFNNTVCYGYECTYFYHKNDIDSLLSYLLLSLDTYFLINNVSYNYHLNINYIFLNIFIYPNASLVSFVDFINIISKVQTILKEYPIYFTPKFSTNTSFSNPNTNINTKIFPIPVSLSLYFPLIPNLLIEFTRQILLSQNINCHFRFVD